jgi:hypothetical protein
MLDSIFKILQLISSFIGRKRVVSIMKDYDKHFLFPMFLKYHHVLQLTADLNMW